MLGTRQATRRRPKPRVNGCAESVDPWEHGVSICFNGGSMGLQLNFNGTSMELSWDFNRTLIAHMGCTLWSNVASWDVPELNGRCFHFYDYQEGNHQQSWFQPEQTAVSSKIDGSALKDRDEAPRSLGWTPRIMSNTIKDMDINQPCWAKTSVFLGVVQLRCTMLYTPIPNICPCAATFEIF